MLKILIKFCLGTLFIIIISFISYLFTLINIQVVCGVILLALFITMALMFGDIIYKAIKE